MSGITGIGSAMPAAYLTTPATSEKGGQTAGAGKPAGGGAGADAASETTTTVVNADGSTTTTVTNAAGAILSVTTTPAPQAQPGGIGQQIAGRLSLSA